MLLILTVLLKFDANMNYYTQVILPVEESLQEV